MKKSLEMGKSYDLTNEKINEIITKKSAGNYAYGNIKDNTFMVSYIGRSDIDLNGRIKHGIGQYNKFKFSYASSPKNAFEKECKNYHDFGETNIKDNEKHPQRPDNTNWKCPNCDVFNS